MSGEFRNQIENNSILNNDGTEVIEVDKVNSIFDTIESSVNEILDNLKPYTVFSELEDIYKSLEELGDKLY